jgi:hypothetical protein
MRIQDELATAFRSCAAPSCYRTRQLWRRICWRQSGVHLQESWYCSPQCLEVALAENITRAALPSTPRQPVRHRIPLGLLLLSRGQINNRQLRQALEKQGGGGGRIGQWLETLGFVTEHQVTAALGMQWSCPVLPAYAARVCSSAGVVPFRLLQKFRMLPVRFLPASRVLYIAFSEGVDYSALYAIEQMLLCRTEACLVEQTAMDLALEQMAHERRDGDLLFESWRDAREIARVACGYVLKFGARQVRVASCGDYLWTRLESGPDFANLLFLRSLPELVRAPQKPREGPAAAKVLPAGADRKNESNVHEARDIPRAT